MWPSHRRGTEPVRTSETRDGDQTRSSRRRTALARTRSQRRSTEPVWTHETGDEDQTRRSRRRRSTTPVWTHDTRELVEVPPEVLARGPLALEAYNMAIAEGRTYDKRVPIMVIGQGHSGKTSLKNSLQGNPFKPDGESTAGIDIDPSHFKVSTEIWKPGKKDQQTDSLANSYEHHAERLTVKNLTQVLFGDELESAGDYLSSFVDVNGHNSTTNGFGTSKDSQSSEKKLPEDIANLVEVLLQDVTLQHDEDIYSVLWDFGGQFVYYSTHPLFLTSRAIFLLVNDLSQNPHDRAQSVVKQGMFTKSEDSFDLRTNLDYLDFWMSSVASLAIEDNSNQQCPKSEVLPEKLPPVFLVCTHADTPYGGGDPRALANKVLGSLENKPYKSHLYDDVFVVDNTKSGQEPECSEVVRLRKELLDVAKELPQMKEAIPIKWLKYEQAIRVMKEDGYKWIPLDSAKKIASDVCNIIDDEQFHTLLNFLHDQRVLIHFDDTPELNRLVVLDPQWLVDVFKEVITVRPYHGKERKFKDLWCKLENEGILEERLLDHVWGPLFDIKHTPKSLIAIMDKFSLLCPLPSFRDAPCSNQYLVPSMLMTHPPESIVELIRSSQIPSLFLKFESCHVPPGMFHRLVLQFFQWTKEECLNLVDPQFYHNFARLYTSEEENCSVVLLCHSFSIEVVVHRGNVSHEVEDGLQSKLSLLVDTTIDLICARAVRRQLELMLESMRNEFCWLKNMRYGVCFICPVCCNCKGSSVNYCRTHRTQGCKQEECLHFLLESQLCNVKNVSCTKSAVAQNNRVPIEQFEPWLVSQIKQPTTDEHDGRIVASAEGRKEVALPGEVQEALLSHSCDAKDIVVQLAKMMQLDQASLQQPEPETKSLIRCLARKAKDSNRRDVFEYLREITPAGTTGPLLPENLDIRDMPVSKGRKLTIYLCGGDEWMEVAEALGLAPEEIRFLEKRHVNPLDAALAFIANQRHITVGELYDLLNECGFPVLADLL